MKSGAIILARLDSKRLPQKALKKIGSKTLIEHCIDRLKSITHIKPILATSNRETDYPLIEIAEKNGIRHFAGDLSNVANRVLGCIDYYQLDYFARINGDSPFLDTDLLVRALEEVEKEHYDFVTNLLPRSFPYGISLEVFNCKTFRKGYNEFKGNRNYEEHITSYFYDNKSNYFFKNTESDFKLSQEELTDVRLVIDTKEDYDRVMKMYNLNNNIFEEIIENIYHTYKEVTKKKI